ncbi:MAG: beta-propeller fold lactonase family protein, partial [Planctomycetota bacterium]
MIPQSNEAEPYTLFEAGQVRPLALSPAGDRLYAVNTPDDRLEIFDITQNKLNLLASIPTGSRPVAVAALDDRFVWVVNHLSDSVSVVDASLDPPRVVRTHWVGDEPRDIVIAGPKRRRAFIATAHRGQNNPVDPELNTPGVPRCDVFVFDADELGDEPGGEPLTILSLFGDTPRALATSPDGSSVYVAVFFSGNRTTTVAVSPLIDTLDGGDTPESRLPKPEPSANVEGIPAPETGIIVTNEGDAWVDEAGTDYSQWIPFSLPDRDIFVIDANAETPAETESIVGVGSTIFNLAIHPKSGALFVSNFEARNAVRFAGRGELGTTLKGHPVDDRITIVASDRQLRHRLLNKHLDRTPNATIADSEAAKSLSYPLEMALNSDGSE